MITGAENVEIHHEFVCTHVQKIAAMYYMGFIDKAAVKEKLMELHGSAIQYTNAMVWIDSSNKLSWLIEPLSEMFSNAKFLALVRDGRKVTSSFYYKLRNEMYDDLSTSIMQRWIENRNILPPPPPEKKYWWNIPQSGQNMCYEFRSFNRLQRISWHWRECNLQILESFSRLPKDRTRIVRLEDMVNEKSVLKDTLDFIEIEYDDLYFSFLKKPRNVFFPMDFQLTSRQFDQFYAICADMMKRFGYDKRPLYEVQF